MQNIGNNLSYDQKLKFIDYMCIAQNKVYESIHFCNHRKFIFFINFYLIYHDMKKEYKYLFLAKPFKMK